MVTVFLIIVKQTELHLALNQIENCYYDHFSCILKGIRNKLLRVRPTCIAHDNGIYHHLLQLFIMGSNGISDAWKTNIWTAARLTVVVYSV